MKFRKKPVVIEATQWFKNGDHPDDGDGVFPPAGAPGTDPRYTGEFAGQRLEGRVVRYFRRPDVSGDKTCQHCARRMHAHGWIDTKEGRHIVCPGDWIITGVQGERYPCKPDIFEATYEPAADPAQSQAPEGTQETPHDQARPLGCPCIRDRHGTIVMPSSSCSLHRMPERTVAAAPARAEAQENLGRCLCGLPATTSRPVLDEGFSLPVCARHAVCADEGRP